MLTIGSRDALQVRGEVVPLNLGLKVLYASDLHLNRWAGHILSQLDGVITQTQPDLVLLGGDLVDLPDGLPLLSAWLQRCPCPVWAVAGNHDVFVGLDKVRRAVVDVGGVWLDGARQFGNLRLSSSPQRADGAAMLCTHDPAVFPQAVEQGYSLVLAGHLHGGQCILWADGERWYPGAAFYRWNGARFTHGQTTMLVSRGVHDTLPIRWNCPREVILCSL